VENAPSENDRRAAARVPLDLWIEEDNGQDVYFQRSANLSAGGLYLEQAVPQPVGTTMKIRFALPGDKEQVRATAEIVKVEAADMGMHLKFVELPVEVTQRIAAFVEQQRRG
jgi:uncharacterized protein (TIGR02266 family)